MDTSERAIIKREPQRRRRSVEEKRRIVEETLEPDASVARIARAHGVNANPVFHWRGQYRQGLLSEGNAETVNLLLVHVTRATARRNYVFEGPDAGGERAASIYSLIGTAKLNGLDPETDLRNVLSHIADQPIKRIEERLPWNFAPEFAKISDNAA